MKTWERTKSWPKGLLKHKGGRYYVRVTIGGKTEFLALKTDDLETAKIRAMEERLRAEKNRKAAASAVNGTGTMGDFLRLYVADLESSELPEATRRRYREHVNFIVKTWSGFSDLRPRDITPDAIKAWRASAVANGSGWRPPGSRSAPPPNANVASFNKALAKLKTMLDAAVEKGQLASNVLRVRVSRQKKLSITETPKKASLPPLETIQKLFLEIESGSGEVGRKGLEIADFLRLMTFTGMRKGEAVSVRPGDLNFKAGRVRVKGTKTESADRVIEMNPDARSLFEKILSRRVRPEPLLFNLNGTPQVPAETKLATVSEGQRSIDRACAKLGAARLTHHDFRDILPTVALAKGVPVSTVAKWLGHKDGGALLLRTYAHVLDADAQRHAATVNFGGA